jgi:hypothetical protein
MTRFQHQDLTGARFERVSLRDAQMNSVDLSGAQLRGVVFNGSRMRGVGYYDDKKSPGPNCVPAMQKNSRASTSASEPRRKTSGIARCCRFPAQQPTRTFDFHCPRATSKTSSAHGLNS